MRGRLLGIKKTYLLLASILISLAFFIFSCYFAVLDYRIYDLWFYNFCVSLSIFELSKGFLFKLDSSLYLGFLLLFLGIAGNIFWLTNTTEYAVFYIFSAFSISSIATFIKTGQKFHLIFAYSIIFVSIFGILLKKNFITWPIFIAFVGAFLLLLILEIIIFFKRRR